MELLLITQDNEKILQKLKSGFKWAINCNKYQSKVLIERQTHYLDYLTDPSFCFLIWRYCTSNKACRIVYIYPKAEIKYYKVMIDGQNILDQPVKNYMRRYDNIQKIATGQGDKYSTGYLVGYPYFNVHNKLIAVDLSK